MPSDPPQPNLYPPDWDLSVLEHPVVLDVPDDLPTDHLPEADPLLHASVQALALSVDRAPTAPARIGDLARAGVVALRTSNGSLELHETLLGWVLVHAWGDPDRHDLAAAAHLRAHRLAIERRTGCGAPEHPTGGTPNSRTDADGDPDWSRW